MSQYVDGYILELVLLLLFTSAQVPSSIKKFEQKCDFFLTTVDVFS